MKFTERQDRTAVIAGSMHPAFGLSMIGLSRRPAADFMHLTTGCQRRASWNADRRGRVCVGESCTAVSQPIQCRCLNCRMPVESRVSASVLVGTEYQYIWLAHYTNVIDKDENGSIDGAVYPLWITTNKFYRGLQWGTIADGLEDQCERIWLRNNFVRSF